MKQTVTIPDTLFEEARKLAEEQQVAVEVLLVDGLRSLVEAYKQRPPFHLRDASVDGNGLQPDVAGASWERIRDMIYEDQ